jgi:hypothetical protein
MKKSPWHVLVISEWRTTPPFAFCIVPQDKKVKAPAEFATKIEAEAAIKVCQAYGPFYSRCLRETYHAVQSPRDVEWITCQDTGLRNLYIKRADLRERVFNWKRTHGDQPKRLG